MSVTGRDLIVRALKKLGVLAEGESASNESASDGLDTLNDLLDSWTNENLFIYSKIREEFTLSPNTSSYGMGSGSDFNTTRPQKIEEATILISGTTPFEVPIRVITSDEWARIEIKTVTSPIPIMVYPNMTYPNATINLWPVPASAYSLVLYSWKPLATLASLTTDLSLPPGYIRALTYALAMELAPAYGKTASPEIINSAQESKAAIKRMNTKPHFLYVDAGLLPRKAVFNWNTGV